MRNHATARRSACVWVGLALCGTPPLVAQPCAACGSRAETRAIAAGLRTPPQISLAPHHPDFLDTNAGSATLAYSTPAYVSRDVARSASLVYNSTQAEWNGFVQVDVTESLVSAPAKMSIQVYGPTGAAVSPEIFYQGSTGTSRLAATFNQVTSANVYRVVVRSYWSDGEVTSSEVNTRILVIDERYSVFGAGWSMPGLQRVLATADGAMVLNGDGTAVFFSRACAQCTYQAPDGEFSALARNADGTWVRTYPDGTRALFTAVGLIGSYQDRAGLVQQTFTWGSTADGRPIPTAITDPTGATLAIAYYPEGYIRSITDPGGRQTVFWYAPANGLYPISHVAVANRYLMMMTYDPSGRVISYRYDGAPAVEYAYDHAHKLASITAPSVSTTDAGVTWPVSTLKSLWTAVLPGAGLGSSATPGLRVDPASVRVTATDPRGNVVKAAVDRYGAPTRIEEPYGRVTVIDRNQHGQVTRTVAPSGHTVSSTWSGVELTHVVDETAHDTAWADYEHTYHQPTYIRHGLQRDSIYYDSVGNVQSTVSLGTGTRRVQQYAYAPDGRLYSVTDPAGHGAFYSYEGTTGGKRDNLARVEVGVSGYTNNRVTTYLHDAFGRDTMVTSPNGDKSRTGYDLLNRVVRSTDPLGNSTAFAFDSVGLASVTDARAQVYRYTRNGLGWVVSETDPRNASISYGYDRTGNLTSSTNRRGQPVTLAYDSLNRVTSRTAGGAITSWSYDPSELWVQVSNAESTDRAEYDPAGRLLRTLVTRGGTTYRLENGNDAQGRRTQLAVYGPWSGAYTTGWHYNELAQLDTLVDFGGGRTLMRYDNDGLWTGPLLPMNGPLGFGISRSYVSTHVPYEIRHPPAVADILNTTYSLDRNGFLAARGQRFTEDFAPYNLGTRVTSYTYDRAGRLTQADVNDYYDSDGTCGTADPNVGKCMPSSAGGIPHAVEQRNYAWDAVGNPVGTSYTVETGNRLTRTSPFNLEYDADGNLTRKYRTDGITFDQRLFWNPLGQLDSVRTNGTTVRYGYNGLGQRVRAGTRQFLYDGDDLLMELNASGLPDRSYTYYPGVDNPHGVRLASGATYYYTTDFPGNVVALINKNRQIVARYTYDDFGHSTAVVDSTGGQPLRYAGREMDSSTGLYYFRARWYDPDLGRFVSEDPIGLEGGINLYVYVGDNPGNGTDPSGLCIKKEGATPTDKKKVAAGEDVWCSAKPVSLDPIVATGIPSTPYVPKLTPTFPGGGKEPELGGGGTGNGGVDQGSITLLIGTYQDKLLIGERCIQPRIGLRQTLNQKVERRGRSGVVRDVVWNIWAPLVFRKYVWGFFGPVQHVEYEYGSVEILSGFGRGVTLPATGSVNCVTGTLKLTAVVPE